MQAPASFWKARHGWPTEIAPLTLATAPKKLRAINVQTMEFLAAIRDGAGDVPAVISANLGPRSDAYAPGSQMTAEEAEAYHAAQVSAWKGAPVDGVSAYTLAYVADAFAAVLR